MYLFGVSQTINSLIHFALFESFPETFPVNHPNVPMLVIVWRSLKQSVGSVDILNTHITGDHKASFTSAFYVWNIHILNIK
jgi:hypothetical protein